jgi:ABC-type oligopeptide transport system substrate-binding subunit
MKRATDLLLVIVALLAAAAATAADKPSRSGSKSRGEGQTYKWIDEKGEVQYGDAVPAEYAQTERVILKVRPKHQVYRG